MQKDTTSNGHLRTQTAVLAIKKPVRETVIAQKLSKGRKDQEERDRREVPVKMTTAYFIAKEELPFSKFQGLINLQKKNALEILSTYANDKSCTEMVSVLGKVFKERTTAEINQSKYSVNMRDDFYGNQMLTADAKNVICDKHWHQLIFCRHRTENWVLV